MMDQLTTPVGVQERGSTDFSYLERGSGFTPESVSKPSEGHYRRLYLVRQPGSAGPGNDPDLSVLPPAGRVLGGRHAGAAGANGAVPNMVRRMTQRDESD